MKAKQLVHSRQPLSFVSRILTGKPLALSLLLSLSIGSLRAQNLFWAVTNGTWDASTPNWTGDATVFANGDNVNFTNTAGGVVTLAAGGVSPGSITVNAASGTYVFTNGPIGGTGGITQNGAGTLSIYNTNTYTGATLISAGKVSVYNASAFGAPSAGTTVAAGAQVIFATGSSGTAEPFTINGNAFLFGNSGLTLSGPITLASDSSVSGRLNTMSGTINLASYTLTDSKNSGDSESWSAIISGTGGLTLKGGGPTTKLTLTGANTYTGTTTLSNGVLNVGKAETPGVSGPLGNGGTISFNGGTLQYSAVNQYDYSSRFDNSANQAVKIDLNGQTVTFASALSSIGGTLTLATNSMARGTLTLAAASSYTGNTTNSIGTLKLGVDNAIPATGDFVMNATTNVMATLDLNGHALTLGSLSSSGAGTNVVDTTAASTAATLTVGANNNNGTFAGRLTNSASGSSLALVKIGSGTITLSGTNGYSGGTTISSGTLVINANSVVSGGKVIGGSTGTGNVTLVDGVTLGQSGSVWDVPTLTLQGNITLTGNVRQQVSFGTLDLAGGQRTLSLYPTGGTILQSINNGIALEGSGRSRWEIVNFLSNLTVTNGTLDLETPYAGDPTAYVGFMFAGGITSFANDCGVIVGPNVFLQTGNSVNNILGTTTSTTPALTVNGIWSLNGGTAAITTVYSLAGSGQVNNAMSTSATTSRTLILNGTAGSTSFSGTLNDGAGSGRLSLSKTGASIQNLAGANTYSGGTTISAGILQVGDPSALGTGVVTLNGGMLDLNAVNLAAGGLSSTNASGLVGNMAGSPASLALSNASTAVYRGSIQEPGPGSAISLVNNSGVEELIGTNSYSGSTTIAGGTLGLGTTGAATNSPITVNDGAALGVVVTAAGTTLTPANLTVGAATGGAITAYLGSLGAPTAPLLQPGSLTVNGPITFNVNSVTPLTTGQSFTLLKHSSAPNIATALGTLPAGAIGHLVTNIPNSSIDLVVDAVTQTLWVGNNGPNWDIGTTVNWTNTALGLTTYADGEAVLFNDSASSANVNLTVNVQPSSVTISNSALNYSFSGPGAMAGLMSLTKNGAGNVTIATSNTFSGGTIINAGTVTLGVNGPTGDLGGGGISNNGTLVVDRSDTPNFTQVISGSGSLTLAGSGTVSLSASNTYSGGTLVSAGNLAINAPSTLDPVTGTNILSGATGVGNVTLSNGVTIAQSANTAWFWYMNTLTLAGDITLPGNARQYVGIKTLDLAGGTRTIHVNPTAGPVLCTVNGGTLTGGGGSGSFQTVDTSTNHPYDGTALPWTVQNGKLVLDSNLTGTNYGNFIFQFPTRFPGNGEVTVGTNVLVSTWLEGGLGSTPGDSAKLTLNGIWNLQANVSPPVVGTNHTVYSLAGSGQVYAAMVSATSPRNLIINGTNGSTAFSGTLNDGPAGGKLSLTKAGGSTQTLAGTNTYTGNTTISGGTLVLAAGGSLKFAIGGNGTNNSILGTGAVTLNGSFNFDLTGASTNANDSWTIVNVGTLAATFGGTFSVAGFSNAGGGNWTNSANGVTYQFSQTTGKLSVASAGLVSQPHINLVQFVGTNLIISGTNGTPNGTYSVRSTNDLSIAVSNWPVVRTGTFGPEGQFSLTNAVNPAEPKRFYLISQP